METEKRLIDANALMEAPVWKCGGDPYDPYYMGYQDALDNVEVTIENLPTVDAVEVVFCDECENCGKCYTESIFRLARIEKPFCCVGKRKTNTNCGAKMDGDGNG